MTPFYADPLVTLYLGDCLDVLPTLEAESVDCVVTDPPYGLEFMGREWDAPWRTREGVGEHNAGFSTMDGAPDKRQGNRGGSWFGSRDGQAPTYLGGTNPTCRNCGGTQHGNDRKSRKRCRCDRPVFPDTIAPRQRAFQQWCYEWATAALRVTRPGGYLLAFGGTRTYHRMAVAIEDAGWIIRDELVWIYASGFPKGRANLKPAHEPIVMARKPGPLRPLAIEECRIPSEPHDAGRDEGGTNLAALPGPRGGDMAGRWPSNVLLSDPELFDEPNPYVVGSGAVSLSGVAVERNGGGGKIFGAERTMAPREDFGYSDSGGYSRFFIIPKADRAERERGMSVPVDYDHSGPRGHALNGDGSPRPRPRQNVHPTVKPIDLMRHLVRLVTPTGGTVLDPFLGSGTTALAASEEGFRCIGIEREPEYLDIAKGRLIATPMGLGLDVPAGQKRPPKTHPDLSKHQPKRRAPSENYTGGWTGTDEEPAA